MSFDKELILDVLEGCRDYFDNRSDADCGQDGFVPNKEMVLLSNVQSALEHLNMTKPVTLIGTGDLLSAAKGIKSIVEELNGSMAHGTWRDDRGMRLKDTPEWIALYNAIADAERDHRDGCAQDGSHYYSVAESAWDEADNGVSVFPQKGAAGGSCDNQELDGTDVAHPAWWRGNDAGVLGAVEVITRALEKGQCPDTGNAGLSGLCKRVVSTQSDLRSLRDNDPYVVGGNHGWEAAIDAVSELVESSGAPGATRLADQIRDLNKLPQHASGLPSHNAIISPQPASTALVEAPSPQSTVDDQHLAQSLSKMVTEWVDGGIKGDTDWRTGLYSVILARIRRLKAKSPSSDRAASEVVERLKELADYLDIHHFASDRHKAADMVSRARTAIAEAKGSGQ